MEAEFTETASLLAEPTRATMLLKLLGGKALPAGELAAAARVTPQTASGHLAKLITAGLLNVESQGRHRYYRLAGTQVADALEAILVLLPRHRKNPQQQDAPTLGTLAHARTCYSHLAGWLGVRVADALQERGYIAASERKGFAISPAGREWLAGLGVHPPNSVARQCLDWTERRPHLGGPVGVSLYRRLLALGWLAPISSSRMLRVTLTGKRELWNQLRIPIR